MTISGTTATNFRKTPCPPRTTKTSSILSGSRRSTAARRRSTWCNRPLSSSRASKTRRETEARAQSLCKSAAQRLRLAEKQRDAAESARHDVVHEFNGKLEDVTQALHRAQQRIVAAEDHALAAEFRAQAAEALLHTANQELAAIEDMIRKRLL